MAARKIQNLIDIIGDEKNSGDDLKEQDSNRSFRRLEQALPFKETKCDDVDPSKVTILILGCGLVVSPLIEYLNFYGYRLVIGTRSPSKADPIIKKLTNPQNVTVEKVDVSSSKSDEILTRLIKESTLTVSLLPYIYHPKAAKIALEFNKDFFTSSYVSDALLKMKEQVISKKLLFLNECGVDPGLDHMSAMKIIDEVHDSGGSIIEFRSICGGLPAPEVNDNPFGYKFSWAPKGVLLASKNSAKQMISGKRVLVEGVDLFAEHNVYQERLPQIGNVEWYYNRDSLKYIDVYGIPEVQTMIRGTYRYNGWCCTMKAIADLKLTSDDVIELGNNNQVSYKAFFSKYLGSDSLKNVKSTVAVTNLEWLGLFSDDLIEKTCPLTPIDVLCNLCLKKLKYEKGEKDMIILKHSFQILFAKDGWREERESVLLDFGLQPNDNSSMARTVTLPLAIAMRAFIEKRIERKGVLQPIYKDIYAQVLNECADLGIEFHERTLKPMIWMRAETKKGEMRVAITPENAKKLIISGFRICIEKCQNRCIDVSEYAKVGCKVVENGSWYNAAPYSAFVLGIKELPESYTELKRRHIFFAHCFKGQSEAKTILSKFKKGNGEILDLEYLVNDKGRRVAAFGKSAGMVGMALGIIFWCKQKLGILDSSQKVNAWKSNKAMVNECVELLKKVGSLPKVIIIGALGRCGSGATYIANECGLEGKEYVSEWDLEETKKGGPFNEIVTDHDIFVNCIRLFDGAKAIKPFINMDLVNKHKEKRRLTVISDVACDPNNPNNPVAVYNQITTINKPLSTVIDSGNNSLLITAIDHLPALIPLEASRSYSDQIIDTFEKMKDRADPVWQRARNTFLKHVQTV